MKQGSFAPDGLCCPADQHYYDPLRLPLDSPPLPGSTGYRRALLPGPAARGRGGPLQFPGQPSDHSTPPYAGGFFGARSRTKDAFHGLRPSATGSAPSCPAHNARVRHDDVAGFASCCGLASRHPLHGVLSLRFDTGISPDIGSQLPGTLASPRTGLAPAGCPELVAQLRHNNLLVVMASKLLDALPIGRAWRRSSGDVRCARSVRVGPALCVASDDEAGRYGEADEE